MTQEEKSLLFKDLCGRLPYGVKILHNGWNYERDDELSTVERVVGIDKNFIYTKVIDTHNGEEYRDDKWPIDTFDDKLFLRLMSSMTEEEREEESDLWNEHDTNLIREMLNFYCSHHLDWNSLIPKGLALEAPEGMYKTE